MDSLQNFLGLIWQNYFREEKEGRTLNMVSSNLGNLGARNEIIFRGEPVNVATIFNRAVIIHWGWFVGKAGRDVDAPLL